MRWGPAGSVRKGLPEAQHAHVLAVDLHEHFTEPDILLRLSADGNAGHEVRAARRSDEVCVEPAGRQFRQSDRVAKLEEHVDTSYRILPQKEALRQTSQLRSRQYGQHDCTMSSRTVVRRPDS